MAIGGVARPAFEDFFEISAAAPERLVLEMRPNAATVRGFVFTRAAERAWQIINKAYAEPRNTIFWVGGPPGSGKTHFLNYVSAIGARSRPLFAERGRQAQFCLQVAGPVGPGEMDAYLSQALAEQIADARGSLELVRQSRSAGGFKMILVHARRTGIATIVGLVDFSVTETRPLNEYLRAIIDAAGRVRGLNLMLILAGRATALDDAVELTVAPADRDEAAMVALGRARILKGNIASATEHLDVKQSAGGGDPRLLFPFHPAAFEALSAIGGYSISIASRANLIRGVLEAAAEGSVLVSSSLFVYPAELFDVPRFREGLEHALGADGRAALMIAENAAARLPSNQRELARAVARTLAVETLVRPGSSLKIAELHQRLRLLDGRAAGDRWTALVVEEIVARLADSTRGIIGSKDGAATFEPGGADAPEVAAYNSALALARRFDPGLTAVHDAKDIAPGIERLRQAMADALESSSRVRRALVEALAAEHLDLDHARARALDDFAALAGAGPANLVELARNSTLQEHALKTISDYRQISTAAAIAPRIQAMKEYLTATGLRSPLVADPGVDASVVALETDCALLAAEIHPRMLVRDASVIESLEVRFQKFKWSYSHAYRIAHAQNRTEMERLASEAESLRTHLEAIARLNSISSLGPPAGAELANRAGPIINSIVTCDFEAQLAPEIEPLCPRCGYVLGTAAPREELRDLLNQSRGVIESKFAALSQSAIARIIREHDRDRRLEGFLKIVQAAQTDALVRVLDDNLTRYLAQLLEENISELTARRSAVIQPIAEARKKARAAGQRRSDTDS